MKLKLEINKKKKKKFLKLKNGNQFLFIFSFFKNIFSNQTVHFILLISRQGKTRLTKWYEPYANKEKARILKEVPNLVLNRSPKLCNFIEWKEYKIISRRYASLYFVTCVDKEDNELLVLEIIHHYVEVLDRYFGNVKRNF